MRQVRHKLFYHSVAKDILSTMSNINNIDLKDHDEESHITYDRKESQLDVHADPFATRKGKTLTWKNVNMTLAAKKDEPERHLLKDVWGEVPARETTAIMGPSGAGKSSLLNVSATTAWQYGG